MAGEHFMKKKGKKTIFTNSVAPKGVNKRATVDTLDRVDNSVAKLLKGVGHKRTKDQRRDRKFVVQQLIYCMGRLENTIKNTTSELAPDKVQAFFVVYKELQDLDSMGNVKRACYSEEFKSALKILVSRAGMSFLKDTLRVTLPPAAALGAALTNSPVAAAAPVAAALSNQPFATLWSLPPGGFAGYDFMSGLEQDGSSVTTESTIALSVTTEDTLSVTTEDTLLAYLA